MYAFAVFAEKYLWSFGCSGTNFTATVNFTNPKSEIQIEIIETQIIGIQVYFVIKKYFSIFSKISVFIQFSKIAEDDSKIWSGSAVDPFWISSW